MQQVEMQHGQAQSPVAQQQRGGTALESPQGEKIAQFEAMAKNGPQALKVAQLAEMVTGSPRMLTQRRTLDEANGTYASSEQPITRRFDDENGAPGVVQRLIVVDDDLDASRLTSAVHIYRKHKDKEKITTIRKAKSVKLAENEKIYMVAHGDGKLHGGRSPKELADILATWGLRPGSNAIKLISCFSGSDAPDWSYANELALKLGFKFKVVGIKGLESTSPDGHTRSTEQLVSGEEFDNVYFKILEEDKSFQAAEEIVREAKSKIETCEAGMETQILVEAFEVVEKLCADVIVKLEKGLTGLIQDKSKIESEDVMPALPTD